MDRRRGETCGEVFVPPLVHEARRNRRAVNPKPPGLADPFATPYGVLLFVPKKLCFTAGLSRNT